ncbi:MAG: adenylate/guanylate cyclase domain-containing protein [Saprospiraceae bacterium]
MTMPRTHVFTRLAWLFALLPVMVFGQNPSADSLARLLAAHPSGDTMRVNLLTDFAWEIIENEPEKAESRLREAISLSEKLGFEKGEAAAWNALGVVEELRGEYETAIQHYRKALAIRQKLGDVRGVAALFNNIGNAHESIGEFELALQNHLENLRMVEQLNDTLRIARAHYNIGVVHEELGDYPEAAEHINEYRFFVESRGDREGMVKAYTMLGNIRFELEMKPQALKWYRQALRLCEQLGDPVELAQAHNNLGNLLDEMDSTQAAIGHYLQAWEIRKGMDDEAGIAEIFNNLGDAHKHLRQYEQAMHYLRQSLRIREKMGDRSGLIEVYNTIGDVLFGQGKLDESMLYVKKYFDLAQTLGDEKFVQKGYKDFAKLYAAKGDWKTAFEYRVQYDELRYKRLDENRAKDFERKEVLFSDRKKQLEIDRTERELAQRDADLARSAARQNALIGGAIALALLALLLYNRNRLRAKANRDLAAKNEAIERERQRADDLLTNILPAATAAELKQHNHVQPVRYESVTVMFTDFKSFTTIAEGLSPEALVAELDECFRMFDAVIERHGIEKIKTIGDAYMCAGGLPIPNDTHAFDVVSAALELQASLAAHAAQKRAAGLPFFEMRIGVHTGPVVAGVVGAKKFAYDIWGDTVNTAARMETGSEPGRVNISETTYELVKHRFRCTFRGRMPAKNKGEIAMYFVEG